MAMNRGKQVIGSDIDMSQLAAKVMLEAKDKGANTLAMFRPTEQQEPFFRKMAEDGVLEVLVGGGNRSGKSTSCFIALASFLLNQPIILKDGTELHMRLPRQRKEAVKVWCIGYDWTHCANTMYRLLFKRDLFRIVRDPVTRQWRSWNPGLPGEVTYDKTTPSPPLLKMSDIEPNTMSYENKRENQIKSFSMEHDGSKVEFYASTGNRPQGSPIDLCLIDEKLYDEEFYDELLMRLIDKRGRLIWSTYPGTCPSAKLQQVSERALAQEGNPSATAFYFRLKGSDNPFTKSKIRDAVISTLDDDQKLARDEGIIGMERWLVYPRFSKYIHRLWSSIPEEDDDLAKACRKCGGIPPDWTRYLILDPGTQNAAVLFVAVPPPKLGDFIVPYDELYLHNVPAKGLAEAVRAKTKGQFFEDFIIDSHAARQTPMGFDGRIGDNYSKEFAACKLRCRRHGSGFSYGSDNVEMRILGVQGAMNVRSDGTVRLRIMTDTCKELVKQLEQYKWGADPKGNPTEKPAKYQKIDVATCFDSETQVLTRFGWKYFKDLSGNEPLATVNMETDFIEYQVPSRIIEKQYSGDMYKFGGIKMDAMVTPDHRMIVYPPKDNENFIAREAKDLLAWDRIKLSAKGWAGNTPDSILIPKLEGRGGGEDIYVNPVDFAEFLGWYIAEGCCVKHTLARRGCGYRIHLAQNPTWKKEIMRESIDRLPWKFSNQPDGFLLSNRQLWTYLKQFGGSCYSKRVPQWIKDSGQDVIASFLKGAILGDGHVRKSGARGYTSANPFLCDDIQELFIKTGTTGSITLRPSSPYNIEGRTGFGGDTYVFNEWLHPRGALRNHDFKPNYGTVEYNGMVYCATVPNSTLIVRRNGRPMISGNCLEYLVSRDDCCYIKPPKQTEGATTITSISAHIASMFSPRKKPDDSIYCGPGVPVR